MKPCIMPVICKYNFICTNTCIGLDYLHGEADQVETGTKTETLASR